MRPVLTGRYLVLDTESTGVDVHSDRIVTACAALVEGGRTVFERQWLIAVDVDIPEAATAVHGVTTAHAREHGQPADVAVKEIAGAVRYAVHSGIPVVAYNAVFDLSLINAECVRHGFGTLEEFCGRPIRPVVDPLVLDKHLDRYRPGKRTLTATCELFGITLDDAHNATADAVAAGQVARVLAERSQMDAPALRALYADRRYPSELVKAFQALGRLDLDRVHNAQTCWYAEQAESLASYWRRCAEELRVEAARDGTTDERREIAMQEAVELDARVDGVSTEWPIRPLPAEVTR